MNSDSMEEIARTGAAEDVMNLLKAHGRDKWEGGKDDRGATRCIDTILYAASQDKDEARKAQKIALVAAYTAHGKKGLKIKKMQASERPELETLRQLAFNGASEKVVELLKAQADDEAAVRAIIEGAQKDRKRRFRRETTEDRSRRSDKKDIIAEFYAKSGRFAPAAEAAPDDLEAKTQIAQLQNRLAEMEKTVANQQQPAKPATLKL